MEEGHEIRLTHFGKFVVKTKKGRKYYNIQTGAIGYTPDKRMIAFVQHKSLDSMNKDK